MDRMPISSGAATACGRLDALVRSTAPALGRWMLELAGELAARGARCRSLESGARAPDKGSAGR